MVENRNILPIFFVGESLKICEPSLGGAIVGRVRTTNEGGVMDQDRSTIVLCIFFIGSMWWERVTGFRYGAESGGRGGGGNHSSSFFGLHQADEIDKILQPYLVDVCVCGGRAVLLG